MADGTLRNPISLSKPLLVLPPTTSAPNNAQFSLKPSTLFWYTIAAASFFASLTSLSTIGDFKALTHPHTTPAIILVALLFANFYISMFLLPADDPCISAFAPLLIDGVSFHIRLVITYYAHGKSVEVEMFVFIVSSLIYLFTFTKVVEKMDAPPRLLHNVLFGVVMRASYEYSYRGVISYGCRNAFVFCCLVVEYVLRFKTT